MTRPVPGAGNPLTVPWVRCLDTGKRGGPEPEAITLETFGMAIPEA